MLRTPSWLLLGTLVVSGCVAIGTEGTGSLLSHAAHLVLVLCVVLTVVQSVRRAR